MSEEQEKKCQVLKTPATLRSKARDDYEADLQAADWTGLQRHSLWRTSSCRFLRKQESSIVYYVFRKTPTKTKQNKTEQNQSEEEEEAAAAAHNTRHKTNKNRLHMRSAVK
jgi:hypothetical protein